LERLASGLEAVQGGCRDGTLWQTVPPRAVRKKVTADVVVPRWNMYNN
jgi:hypothetical protein